MERRDAIRYTAVFLGAGLASSTILTMMQGCTVDTSDDWAPSFFSKEESDFILELGETMLPKTNTPGAKDAMINRYLDTIRPLRFTESDNEAYKSDINTLMTQANAEMSKEFIKSSPEERLEWVKKTDTNAFTLLKNNPAMKNEERPFYLKLKEDILSAYFSSEAVAKNYFAYDPIPGKYEPCIPYTDIGKAWAF